MPIARQVLIHPHKSNSDASAVRRSRCNDSAVKRLGAGSDAAEAPLNDSFTPAARRGLNRSADGFTQRENDDESGLMHYRARTYDPKLGRFLQVDPPVGRRASKHYSYGSNAPAMLVDPLGQNEKMRDYLRKRMPQMSQKERGLANRFIALDERSESLKDDSGQRSTYRELTNDARATWQELVKLGMAKGNYSSGLDPEDPSTWTTIGQDIVEGAAAGADRCYLGIYVRDGAAAGAAGATALSPGHAWMSLVFVREGTVRELAYGFYPEGVHAGVYFGQECTGRIVEETLPVRRAFTTRAFYSISHTEAYAALDRVDRWQEATASREFTWHTYNNCIDFVISVAEAVGVDHTQFLRSRRNRSMAGVALGAMPVIELLHPAGLLTDAPRYRNWQPQVYAEFLRGQGPTEEKTQTAPPDFELPE